MRRLTDIVLALLLFGSAGALAAPTQDIQEFQLDNGLKVIVRPDNRAPVVVSQIWYKVGSSYEPPGITGVSHVLEHMMFKGTPKHPAGEFSRLIALNGGRENAFTSRDYTAYFQQLSNDRLALSFELEADRMRNLRIQEQEFEKEIQVVMEERRLRTEDDPIALALERFYTLAYPLSPYRNPVIGWMGDLQNMKVKDLEHWYRQWYAPNNATLVVAGDVDPKEVLQLARKHFGKIPKRNVPQPRPPVELHAAGTRRMVQELPAQLPYLAVGYNVPSLATATEPAEVYALDVLAGVLDGGASARFASELVRGQEVAAGVSASYSMVSRLDSQFLVAGYPSRDKSLDELEAAVLAQIARLREQPVSAAELERVKNQLIADHLYQLDSVFYQAMQIGVLETNGIGWRALAEYENNIRAVTAEQVQAVANKYLNDNRRAVLHLIPQSGKGGKA